MILQLKHELILLLVFKADLLCDVECSLFHLDILLMFLELV